MSYLEQKPHYTISISKPKIAGNKYVHSMLQLYESMCFQPLRADILAIMKLMYNCVQWNTGIRVVFGFKYNQICGKGRQLGQKNF